MLTTVAELSNNDLYNLSLIAFRTFGFTSSNKKEGGRKKELIEYLKAQLPFEPVTPPPEPTRPSAGDPDATTNADEPVPDELYIKGYDVSSIWKPRWQFIHWVDHGSDWTSDMRKNLLCEFRTREDADTYFKQMIAYHTEMKAYRIKWYGGAWYDDGDIAMFTQFLSATTKSVVYGSLGRSYDSYVFEQYLVPCTVTGKRIVKKFQEYGFNGTSVTRKDDNSCEMKSEFHKVSQTALVDARRLLGCES